MIDQYKDKISEAYNHSVVVQFFYKDLIIIVCIANWHKYI